MLSSLWGRITGKDKGAKYPDQQAAFLGRGTDYTIVFPYGLYADLPAETLLKEIAPGVAVPVTVKRPADTEQGEPTFFHPATNTRMIMRNSGDLDIITGEAGGNVNIQAVNAVVTASASITLDAPETTITGGLTVDGDTTLGTTVTSGGKNIGGTHTHVGSPTAATGPVTPTGAPI